MTEEKIQFIEHQESAPEEKYEGKSNEPQFESATEQVTKRIGEKYAQILSQVKTAQAPVDDVAVTTDADWVSKEGEVKAVIAKLVALAETKGVAHAVAVARKMQDLYILDTMHDTLADELFEAFRDKGLIVRE